MRLSNPSRLRLQILLPTLGGCGIAWRTSLDGAADGAPATDRTLATLDLTMRDEKIVLPRGSRACKLVSGRKLVSGFKYLVSVLISRESKLQHV